MKIQRQICWVGRSTPALHNVSYVCTALISTKRESSCPHIVRIWKFLINPQTFFYFFNCAKVGCAHSGDEKKRVIVIFLTFDRALLQNSPCTIVIGRISSRNTFFKNCLALNCFAGQSVYHRTFYFWCQVLTKETNNILFLWFTSLQLSGVFDDFVECRVDKGCF